MRISSTPWSRICRRCLFVGKQKTPFENFNHPVVYNPAAGVFFRPGKTPFQNCQLFVARKVRQVPKARNVWNVRNVRNVRNMFPYPGTLYGYNTVYHSIVGLLLLKNVLMMLQKTSRGGCLDSPSISLVMGVIMAPALGIGRFCQFSVFVTNQVAMRVLGALLPPSFIEFRCAPFWIGLTKRTNMLVL